MVFVHPVSELGTLWFCFKGTTKLVPCGVAEELVQQLEAKLGGRVLRLHPSGNDKASGGFGTGGLRGGAGGKGRW